jgi:outer membrane protein
MIKRRRMNLIGAMLLSAILLAAPPATAEQFTLNECINLALVQNASVLSPGLKVGLSQAEQGVWTAWGDVLPSISWGADYLYFHPSFFDSRTGREVSSRYSTTFNMRQTLFDGLNNVYSLKKSYQDRRASRESYRSAELSLILDVKTKYFTLLKNQRLVDVRNDAVARAEEQLKTVQSRYELGSASLSEVLKAKVQVGTEKLSLLTAQNDVKVARADLNRLMNRDVNAPLDVVAEMPGASFDLPLSEAEQYALSNRPDYLAAVSDYRSSRSNQWMARSNWLPSVDLSVSRDYNTIQRADWFAFKDADATWSVFVSFSYPIFSGFFKKTVNATANVAAKASQEALEQAKNDALFAVRDAYLGYELAQEATQLASDTEASAQEDFNLAQERYNLGAATTLDILDAQESLTQAKTDRVNAEFDLELAAAALQRAMGQGR